MTYYSDIRQQEIDRMTETLRSRYPAAFTIPRRPLALHTFEAISKAMFPRDAADPAWLVYPKARLLSAVLAAWVRSDDYLRSCTFKASRYDLSGNVLGSVTSDQAKWAAAEVLRQQKLKLCSVRDVEALAAIDRELNAL